MTEKTLAELADYLNCTYHGDGECVIHGVATLKGASTGTVSFLENNRYHKQLATTSASIVILRQEYLNDCPCNALIVENPYYAYAKVAELFVRRKTPSAGIHHSAQIGENCTIHPSVSVGANSVIEDNVCLSEDVIIGPGCVIGMASTIGKGTRLFANVTLYEECCIGERCCIHSGAVIGADGFGNANEKGAWYRVPQLGCVRIGNDVDVGANTTIDRGAIEDTVIHDGVRLDNLIQIGHNVQIGEHTAMAGCSAVAGSTKIGKHCLIGGSSGFNGHIEISDNVFISGMTGVRNNISKPGVYASGISAIEDHKWRKTVVRIHQLDDTVRRFNKLEKVVKRSLDLTEEEE